MFARIVYPTDFSGPSGKAIDYIRRLRDAGAREVVIVHVLDRREITELATAGPILLGSAPEAETEAQAQMREEIERRIREVRRAVERAGLKTKVRLPIGAPDQEILRIAREEEASLIVIGSHGKSNLRSALLGSVSASVIRNARQPVLVVKRDRSG
ncbi:MAG: universal stress protein [Methanomicrobiaceae archaeon]|uniref:Universal stress protein family n=1 Tax=hydrocarbon metagenome TaxID=938273 RepID=A0A0W8FIG7_9ZZZZ|nr:universal stress protein [Methanomicrobiaceae archaeon]